MPKKTILGIFIVIIVILISIGWNIIANLTKSHHTVQKEATLIINTNPSAAVVYINNVKYQGPVKISVPFGNYNIDVSKVGYLNYNKNYSITDSKDYPISIKLSPDIISPDQSAVEETQ